MLMRFGRLLIWLAWRPSCAHKKRGPQWPPISFQINPLGVEFIGTFAMNGEVEAVHFGLMIHAQRCVIALQM